MFVFVLRNQSCFEPENVLVVCEQFSHIFFGRFGLKTENAAKRIFRSAIAVERRNLMLNCNFLTLFNFDGNKFDTQFIPVVCFSEVIGIIDDTVSSEDIHMLPDGKVLR